MSDTQPTTGERLVRLEGKLDAYAAGQSARLDEHERRLSSQDLAISDLRVTAATHVTRDELAEMRGPRTSAWTIASVIVGAVVGLGSLLAVLITLMRVIPDIPS